MSKTYLVTKTQTSEALMKCREVYTISLDSTSYIPLSKKEARLLITAYSKYLETTLPKNCLSSFGYVNNNILYLGE